ncbi:MAG: SHOCT domain-containing protein [Mangrovicoccus sp.]|nr:SHOCT domain-containing protein [Mangrovicoccus sp.]
MSALKGFARVLAVFCTIFLGGCAGTEDGGSGSAAPSAGGTGGDSTAEQLTALQASFAAGVITREDYDRQRYVILAGGV